MSGISIIRAGAAGLLVALLFAAPLAQAASSPSSEEAAASVSPGKTESGQIGFFSFVMSLLSDVWESDAKSTASEEPILPLIELPIIEQADGNETEQQNTGGENGAGIDPIGGG